MKTIFAYILGILILALGLCLTGFIFGYPVMWLWNWLMPTIFGLTRITFWQSFGIVLLTRLIFSGITKYERS